MLIVVGLAALSIIALCAASETSWLDLSAATEGVAVTIATLKAPLGSALRRRRGRPRKFAAPSRAVTLTLPESILERLSAIDQDLSRAVAHLVSSNGAGTARKPAELSVFGNRAVITIRPTAALARHAGIDLVPLPDGRALMSFDQPKSIAELELLLFDALDNAKLSDEDRKVFKAIGQILKEARRANDVTLLHQSIIVLESPPSHRAAPPRRTPRLAAKSRRSLIRGTKKDS